MTLVLGVDPGHKGAFAVYDTDTERLVSVQDMPIWFQVVGNKKRPRLDPLALADMFEMFELQGVGLMVLEAVGGRPAQSASAAFVFGYGLGLIYMCGLYSRIPVETVPARNWKRFMNVPGKGKADDTAIMQRAGEMFPHDHQMFRTERGGKRIDRAEAAMLAKYGGEHIIKRLGATADPDPEYRLTYASADTGG